MSVNVLGTTNRSLKSLPNDQPQPHSFVPMAPLYAPDANTMLTYFALPLEFIHSDYDFANRAFLIQRQVEFYFSIENLCKDMFLRSHMDDQGWVHLSLLASFNRIKALSSNLQFIRDAVSKSHMVTAPSPFVFGFDDISSSSSHWFDLEFNGLILHQMPSKFRRISNLLILSCDGFWEVAGELFHHVDSSRDRLKSVVCKSD
eukprot:c14331_g1_i2.p1 GENE.c14331_g1_i2~~c14331_g1_i2.p1  ORF type:complete len:202 (+),score=18.45 c14331_g1_i2:68-673(+)